MLMMRIRPAAVIDPIVGLVGCPTTATRIGGNPVSGNLPDLPPTFRLPPELLSETLDELRETRSGDLSPREREAFEITGETLDRWAGEDDR